MLAGRRCAWLLLVFALAACAPTAQVSRGGGAAIETVRGLGAGSRPRVAVVAVLDRSGGAESLAAAVAATNRRLPADAQASAAQLLSGIRDLLTTELFVSDRFIVLDREGLDEVLAEQVFAAPASAAVELPPATLEGADLLVFGAITAVDPGLSGGALPLPVPFGNNDGFGILNLRAARGYIAMDLRVVDARTARVLNATVVEGRNWRFGADFTGYFDVGGSVLRLPGLLRLYRNTPLEEALQRMVTAAIERIAAAADR